MRVRIHMTSGTTIDAEEFSSDGGASWSAISLGPVATAMNATSGYTIVRDLFTGEWRAFRNVHIESIGPAYDVAAAVDAEVERRITTLLAERLPKRVEAAAPTVPAPTPIQLPPDGGEIS